MENYGNLQITRMANKDDTHGGENITKMFHRITRGSEDVKVDEAMSSRVYQYFI